MRILAHIIVNDIESKCEHKNVAMRHAFIVEAHIVSAVSLCSFLDFTCMPLAIKMVGVGVVPKF